MQIQKSHASKTHFPTDITSIPLKFAEEQAGASTLKTLAATSCVGSLFSLCFAPFRMIGRSVMRIFSCVRNCLCYYRGSSQAKIDYVATKKVFRSIHTLVLTPGEDHEADKKLGVAYKRLSDSAQARFREHIGWAVAKQQGQAERPDQEKWASENWNKIQNDINLALKDRSSGPLAVAVKSFYAEIERSVK